MPGKRGQVSRFDARKLVAIVESLEKTARTIRAAVEELPPDGVLELIDVRGVEAGVDILTQFSGRVQGEMNAQPAGRRGAAVLRPLRGGRHGDLRNGRTGGNVSAVRGETLTFLPAPAKWLTIDKRCLSRVSAVLYVYGGHPMARLEVYVQQDTAPALDRLRRYAATAGANVNGLVNQAIRELADRLEPASPKRGRKSAKAAGRGTTAERIRRASTALLGD